MPSSFRKLLDKTFQQGRNPGNSTPIAYTDFANSQKEADDGPSNIIRQSSDDTTSRHAPQVVPFEGEDVGENDKHGMFTLIDKHPEELGLVDIVALHGLNGHYRKTWSTTGTSGAKVNWLKTMLPQHVPKARIMSFGYDSAVQFSKSTADIGDFAEALLADLVACRKSKVEKRRPIIFICHSLGGIVFKQALVRARERDRFTDLLSQIRGVAFFGTPHAGSSAARFGEVLAIILKASTFGGSTNTRLVTDLRNNSETLRGITKSFVDRGKALQILTFYETEKMDNLNFMVVDKTSAVMNLPNETTIPISANHITMCKFSDSQAGQRNFRRVGFHLKEMVDALIKAEDSGLGNLSQLQLLEELLDDAKYELFCTENPDRAASLYDLNSERLQLKALNRQDQACIEALFATAGDYDRHREQLDMPVQGTCSWIFQHHKFVNFRNSEDPSLLWITGNPGCGKSILSRFLTDTLESIAEDKDEAASKPIICSFFFKDGQDKRTQSESAVSSLLHQLTMARPILSWFAREELAAKGSAFTLSPEAVWRVMCKACSRVPKRQVICIVDALDECSENSRNRFIRMMLSTFSSPDAKKTAGWLKVLVTSRPQPEIEMQFKFDTTIRLRGENETRSVAHDIGMVIKDRVQKLKTDSTLTPETCEVVERVLNEKADGTFLWISLVLESIISGRSRKLSAVEKRLAVIPKDLDALYAHALQESDEEEEEISRKLLSILLAATRPLSLKELNICLSLNSTTKCLSDMEHEPDINHTVKSYGGFFIRIAHSQVSLVHQTAREYLLRDDRALPGQSWKHSIGILESNFSLAQSCLQFLLLRDWTTYIEDHTADQEPSMYAPRLLAILSEGQSDFYRYAAKNWFVHINSSGSNCELPPEHRKNVKKLCDQTQKPFALWWSCYASFEFWDSYAGKYYLDFAAARGDLIVLKELMTANSLSIKSTNHYVRDVLVSAIEKNRDEIRDWIFSEFDSTEVDVGPALVSAILNKDSSLVEIICRNTGIDLNRQYSVHANRYTPLEMAIRTDSLSMVRLLVARGATCFNWSTFQAAVKSYNEEIIAFVLEKTRNEDPTEKAALLHQAVELAFANKTFSGVMNLVSEGLAIPHPHCLPFQLMDASNRKSKSDVVRLVGEGARDDQGIALILASYSAATLRVLLDTQVYPVDRVWEAFKFLTSDTAGLYRKLLCTRFDNDYTSDKVFRREIMLGEEEEDECLPLFLRRLTGLDRSFSSNAIALFLSCGDRREAWPARQGIIRHLLEKVLQDTEPKTAASFFTLAALCEAGDESCFLLPGFNVNSKDRYGMTPLLAAILGRSNNRVSYLLRNGAKVAPVSWHKPSVKEPMLDMTDSTKSTSIFPIDPEFWDENPDWIPSKLSRDQAKMFERYTSVSAVTQSWESIWAVLGQHSFTISGLGVGLELDARPLILGQESASEIESPVAGSLQEQSPKVSHYFQDFVEMRDMFDRALGHHTQSEADIWASPIYAFFNDMSASLVLPSPYTQKVGLAGRTALHLTAERGLHSFIIWLISIGQSLSAVDDEGRTPLHSLSPFNNLNTNMDTVIKAMLQGGANMAAVDKAGNTPLHTSISQARFPKAATLIQLGSPVNIQNYSGWTPLHEVTRAEFKPPALLILSEQLVEKGAVILAKDVVGLTPLHYAILHAAKDRHDSGTEMLKILVRKAVLTGGLLSDRYDDGLTLFEFAQQTRQGPLPNETAKNELDDVIDFLRTAASWGHSGLEQSAIVAFHELSLASAANERVDSFPMDDYFDNDENEDDFGFSDQDQDADNSSDEADADLSS
ncbi:hypothetical protein B0J13DRAFT_477392 [Dactylonectria estremocensis]|uniref:DUF676 domain-containing protein n=1 Tax=Dactylonectria estremocensis TaxID=1079267 RepID=A0A9P9J025_9HYPO|nr:hypothetical protein B0J13DRAFT_477392 [Dactylonectria estremocensis]